MHEPVMLNLRLITSASNNRAGNTLPPYSRAEPLSVSANIFPLVPVCIKGCIDILYTLLPYLIRTNSTNFNFLDRLSIHASLRKAAYRRPDISIFLQTLTSNISKSILPHTFLQTASIEILCIIPAPAYVFPDHFCRHSRNGHMISKYT